MTTETKTPNGKVVIAGGTGFIGTNLARHLDDLGCEVVLLSRHIPKERGPWEHAKWDGRTLGDWAHHLEGACLRYLDIEGAGEMQSLEILHPGE